MTKNLRTGISDLVNDLQKVAINTTNAQQQIELSKIINALMIIWQQVIFDQLDLTSKDYKDALTSLGASKKAAAEAKKDLDKTVDAIKKATESIKAIDKVVKFALKLLV